MIKVLETASYSYPKELERTNQDSILSPIYVENGVLFAIADGVGSYKGGEFASQLAIDYLSKIKYKTELTFDLKLTFSNIRNSVLKLTETNPDFKNAATTLTLGFVDSSNLYIGHIGDCRLYVKDKNYRLIQLTKDHTQLQELVDEKLYSKKFLQDKKVKNILTTAIANNVEMRVEFHSIPLIDLLDDDNKLSIFLMSDGTHKYWDRRPRFSQNTISNITRFASSLKKRTEHFIPSDDYSLVALTIKREEKI